MQPEESEAATDAFPGGNNALRMVAICPFRRYRSENPWCLIRFPWKHIKQRCGFNHGFKVVRNGLRIHPQYGLLNLHLNPNWSLFPFTLRPLWTCPSWATVWAYQPSPESQSKPGIKMVYPRANEACTRQPTMQDQHLKRSELALAVFVSTTPHANCCGHGPLCLPNQGIVLKLIG